MTTPAEERDWFRLYLACPACGLYDLEDAGLERVVCGACSTAFQLSIELIPEEPEA